MLIVQDLVREFEKVPYVFSGWALQHNHVAEPFRCSWFRSEGSSLCVEATEAFFALKDEVREGSEWILIDRPNYGQLVQAFTFSRFFFGRWWPRPQVQFLLSVVSEQIALLQSKQGALRLAASTEKL